MGLETATTINQLVVTNPVHTDGLNQGDGHLRLIKATLQNTFPNFSGSLNSSQTQIDAAVGILTGASGAATFPVGTVTAPSISFAGDATTGFYWGGAGQIDIALGGVWQGTFAPTLTTLNQPVQVNGNVASTGTISAAGAYTGGTGQLCPAGSAMLWFSTVAPTGWAFLNGQQVSASSNPGLASIFGSTGGNVTLPDFRCLVPIGQDNMGGRGTLGTVSGITTLGSVVGVASVTLTTGQCPSGLITLNFNDSGHVHPQTGGTLSGSGTGVAVGNFGQIITTTNTGSATTGISASLSDHGGNGSHTNVQPSYAVGYIIKLG